MKQTERHIYSHHVTPTWGPFWGDVFLAVSDHRLARVRSPHRLFSPKTTRNIQPREVVSCTDYHSSRVNHNEGENHGPIDFAPSSCSGLVFGRCCRCGSRLSQGTTRMILREEGRREDRRWKMTKWKGDDGGDLL